MQWYWCATTVVLSSRCNLNMKDFQTPEYSQEVTSMMGISQEEDTKSLVLLIMENCDLDEHWETKILQRNGLLPKCMELEQQED